MSLAENENGKPRNPAFDGDADPMLVQALGNFRQCVHAWSDAVYHGPRSAMPVIVHRSWRTATAWALGCVLAVGSLTGGFYERHQRQVVARQRAEQEAQQRQMAVQQSAHTEDEDLLATVDNDVSRAVPAAMEPLAQLMDADEQQ
jgi:transposase